eukprot:CAMPEP_0206583972 /NCGR_PEP_ID=MMETSP0325_2-20121206/35436_1 /ASSEMBLY_ACC=CAM_ASM_000347 /TAXON_ID=2866 /ORGANISM="Crypthecodinium cohnii, Strain Seligo" /LENGTH=118 /DNA_ID=CAMNT_0054091023 /DNA_START=121 /DNA_END=474 /DNA_ORIENTATION=-
MASRVLQRRVGAAATTFTAAEAKVVTANRQQAQDDCFFQQQFFQQSQKCSEDVFPRGGSKVAPSSLGHFTCSLQEELQQQQQQQQQQQEQQQQQQQPRHSQRVWALFPPPRGLRAPEG